MFNSGTINLTKEGQLYNTLDNQVGLDSSGFNVPSVVDQNVSTNIDENQSAVKDDFDNPAIKLREMKLKNPNNPSLASINVNSIRNKHSDLFTFLDCKIDILTIAATKPFLLPSSLCKVIKNHFSKIETKIMKDYLYMNLKIILQCDRIKFQEAKMAVN